MFIAPPLLPVGLIGQRARAAELAVDFYDTLRAEIVVLTGGLLDESEVAQTTVSAALDTFAALVRNDPNAGEALTEGIIRLMAMEFHKAGMSYDSATSRVLAAFQTSWLALDGAVEPPAKAGAMVGRDVKVLVGDPPVDLALAFGGAPAEAVVGHVEPTCGEGCPGCALCTLDTEVMALGDPPLFCMIEQHSGARCYAARDCVRADCKAGRSGASEQ